MSGDVSIKAGMTVVTKAKLESVNVGGNCDCGEGPPPPPPRTPTPPPVVTQKTNVEVVFLVDGSDSFDRTKIEGSSVTELGGVKTGDSQFNESMRWCGDMIWKKLVPGADAGVVASVVQFSGIKQLENSYSEDNDGFALDDSVDLKHYNVEMEPQAVTASNDMTEQLGQTTALDGNSQLFLALNDMSNEKFINKLNAATNDKPVKNVVWEKRRVLIIITDDEWDINSQRASVKSTSGSTSALNDSINEGAAKRQAIIDQVKANYGTDNDQMFAVIVTPNAKSTENNATIIKELCNGEKSHLHRLTEAEFSAGMQKALDDIASKILAGTESVTL